MFKWKFKSSSSHTKRKWSSVSAVSVRSLPSSGISNKSVDSGKGNSHSTIRSAHSVVDFLADIDENTTIINKNLKEAKTYLDTTVSLILKV